MMENKEIMLECMKLGLVLTSPTVSNRYEGVVNCAKMLYSEIVLVETPESRTDSLEPTPKKRGRPKSRPDTY
jgi:hypothetical protein